MKRFARLFAFFIWMLLASAFLMPELIYGQSPSGSEMIAEWQILWENESVQPGGNENITVQIPASSKGWISVAQDRQLPAKPPGIHSVWMRVKLPEFQMANPAIFIPKVYGQNLKIYLDGNPVYESFRRYNYDVTKILLPLKHEDSGKELYIRAETKKSRIGIPEAMLVGNYQLMQKQYMTRNLDDIIFGAAYLLISFIMIVCAVFLKKAQLSSWISLALIILSIGVLIITYSPFLYSIYVSFEAELSIAYDLALYVLFPGMCYFFECMFGEGIYGMIGKFRLILTGYSLYCSLFLVVNTILDLRYNDLYYICSVSIMGIFMLMTLLLLLGFSIVYAIRGNRDAMILSGGFAFLALSGIGELVWFYSHDQNYDLYYWKWGVFGFVLSLIVLLGRRLAWNHERVVQYSRELELHNNQIQRAEKMEIISELAASVAHEVRNPLQVTRGFLQMLTERSSLPKDKQYFSLAIEELDRASTIITDFLTFAKPQLDQISVLELDKEFEQIDGIMSPMANLQGVEIRMEIPGDLQINGNSSKLKQALINIIKNSIEAASGEGLIRIWAYREKEEVVIHIKDNGEGMEPQALYKLGEPYFSTKTKGTGLGLMVTFRIIEVMRGSIRFFSEKGRGTEAIIRFPLA